MRTTDYFTALLCQFFTYVVIVASDSLSSSQCSKLGFSSNYLMCSNCNDLKQFKLDELEDSCRQCCLDGDEEEGKAKYHRAVLEVCSWKLGRYAQISAFIRSDRPSQFPSFSVQYARGVEPVLHLYNEQDEKVESMGIEKWDTDTLTAFLEENLSH